jgi:hypothetical protein
MSRRAPDSGAGGSGGGGNITINLPTINGALEFGISAGVDPSLSEDTKLKVVVPPPGASVEAQNQAASATLYANWEGFGLNISEFEKRVSINTVWGLIVAGFIRTYRGGPSSDWVKVEAPVATDDSVVRSISEALGVEYMKACVTLVAAAKANYWQTNHHTGQGKLSGYPKKVLEVKFASEYKAAGEDRVLSTVHKIGHWACTRHVLQVGGVEGLLQTDNVFPGINQAPSFSAETKMRFSSLPAGQHQVAVTHAALVRLNRSTMLAGCPDFQNMRSLHTAYNTIIANPAVHHVGAAYLTGSTVPPRAQDQGCGTLGRLGTYITKINPKSTLAKSPHFSVDSIQSADDYSSEWASLIDAYLSHSRRNIGMAERFFAQGKL